MQISWQKGGGKRLVRVGIFISSIWTNVCLEGWEEKKPELEWLLDRSRAPFYFLFSQKEVSILFSPMWALPGGCSSTVLTLLEGKMTSVCFFFLFFFPGFTKSLQLTNSCWVLIRDQMCCETSCSPVLPSVPQPDLVLSDAYSLGGPWLAQPACSNSPLNSVCSCANWLVCCCLGDKTTEVLRTVIWAWRNQGWESRGWLQ